MIVLDSFHFLRPLWLIMLIPCLVMAVMLWRRKLQQSSWKHVIAPHLLPHLLQGKEQKSGKLPYTLLILGWFIACLGLAGPTWEKIPIPVNKSQEPLVVVVDMSYNMLATDLKPNRLARLRYKLLDLFENRKEGLTGLVVYAGSAHTVAPLTDDSRTLANLVKALSPDIMPSQGNNPASGIEVAINLLQQSLGKPGTILLITSQVSDAEAHKIESMLKSSPNKLSIIGIGSEQGAPISLPRGGFLKNEQGKIVIPQLERDNLINLARKSRGTYHDFTLTDADLKQVLPKTSRSDETIQVERQFDQWHDAGFWLVLLLLPLALGAFRRGWLTLFLIAVLYQPSPNAMALEWQSLWKNQNQQGAEALDKGNPEGAAELFKDQRWKAESLFQAKKYKEAAELFGTSDTASQLYNKANALAKAGELKQAITTYQQAQDKLSSDPEEQTAHPALKEDIKFNKALVEKLLKDQENQKNNKDQKNKDQQKDNNQQQDQQQSQDQSQQQDGKNSQDQQQSRDNANPSNQQDKQNQQSSPENQQDPESAKDQSSQNQQQDSSQEPEEQQSKPESSGKDEDQQAEGEQAEANQTPVGEDDSPITPDEQALESWLRTIPDDPGGLLRRKFMQQREQEQREE